jgi:hypothetical protein
MKDSTLRAEVDLGRPRFAGAGFFGSGTGGVFVRNCEQREDETQNDFDSGNRKGLPLLEMRV